ncbi:hypothetical protein TMatcc_003370 [Talaromyces marneffei ATCC 18224]|uniref:Eukaryotic translation initation factor eIF1a-like protein, putative n=1 Tax=Talaromyces marneffei (strain ATCC 18224 / CBS 334.59 / QM 7333) TaxID=441960 RepID=B6Q4R5_TALMQ|nr:uncharacterized protein EYB26_001573 [Talaromyces marneffei]EEA28304.1 eukaryotic translation initation factor eIF1a-like protein, putative [Talaromyces marneffei ATCC 18224]KAE8556060.1 hypothetical protein EYB25_000759 [Talaromyces marneffei]QGA13921.1 hypothetical protein EYB26_001573 [Talaromyces marneffei]
MAPPKRKLLATAEEGLYPPATLPEGHQLARIIKATGNNLYSIEWPSKQTALVELPARFRSTIWMKRGSFVVVDTNALDDRENKLAGEIVNVVRGEKAWRKAAFWPKEFVKQSYLPSDSEDEEESRVGKMPSSDEEDDE